MSEELQVSECTVEVKNIPLDLIDLDWKSNYRGEDSLNSPEFAGLVDSIRATGRVTQLPDLRKAKGGRYDAVTGFMRLTAAREVGLTSVDCKILPGNTAKYKLKLLNLQENVARKQLTPMEEARGIEDMLKSGQDRDKIAEALGWSKTKVTQRLELLTMSTALQDALSQDRVTVSQARTIDALPSDQHEKWVEVARTLSTNTLREQVSQEVDRLSGVDLHPSGDGEGVNVPEESTAAAAPAEPFEENAVDVGAVANSVQALLMDIAAHAYRTSDIIQDEDGLEDAFGRATLVITTTSWSALPVDDLAAFETLLSSMHQHLEADGAADYEAGDGLVR